MDNHYHHPVMAHMRTLFGLNPDIMPSSLRFPMLPPGVMHPATHGFSVPSSAGSKTMVRDAISLTPNLEDFQQMYQRHASRLFTSHSSALVPPGHPLYTRHTSVNILKSENEKLAKENVDLKKQLDDASAKPDAHNP